MNIYVRATAFARSNMGHGRLDAETLKQHKSILSLQEGVEFMCGDMLEDDVFDIVMEEAEAWKKTLESTSDKQARASWPEMMVLFEEAGV